MKKVDIYTDGSCLNNPGAGGWAAILKYRNAKKSISGGEPFTTNNRMELTAAIEALKILKEPCEVTLTTDSKYLCDSMNLGWARKWKQNGWIKPDKEPALNPELWETLIDLCDIHKVEFVWIKGHAGHEYNEICDNLARNEASKFQ